MAIEDTDIETLAKAPKKTQTEEGTVEERSIGEVIEAQKHLAGQTASAAVPWGLRVARCKPGGAT